MRKSDRQRFIRDRLEDLDISARQLCKVIGMDPAVFHRINTGERAMRTSECRVIARALQMKPAELLALDEVWSEQEEKKKD